MTDTVQLNIFFPISLQFGVRKILFSVALLLGFLTVFPQQTTLLPFTKLEIKNGLPGINIRKITKDKYGFMWFATQDGLSRFDGKSYINLNSYNVDRKRKILGTDIYDVRPDLSGNYLWALSPYGGLNKIDLKTCNVLISYQVEQSIKPNTSLWYKCLTENDSHLIIGTNEGIISSFDKAKGKTDLSFSLEETFGYAGALEDVMIDAGKQVWYFISGSGILVTDSTLRKKIAFISCSQLDTQPFDFTDYAVFQNTLFLTTSKGLKTIDIKNQRPVIPESGLQQFVNYCNEKELHCISIYDSGCIVSGKNILYKTNLNTGQFEEIQLAGNYEDRSWITLSNSILLEKNNVWIGSQYGVAWIRNFNSPFVPYFNSFDGKNIKINHAITLYAENDSVLFVCGDDGLYSLNHLSSRIRKFEVDDFYYSVFPIKHGYFIASGVYKGLQLFNKDFKPLNLLAVFPALGALKNELIMCSARMGDSIVYMASQNKNGLYIWNTNSGKIDTINTRSGKISLQNDNINRLYIDSKKQLWIICENAVSIYDHSQKTIQHLVLTDPNTRLPITINMDVCEINNHFWLTSYGTGIVELSDDLQIKKIYNETNGINNLGLYKIYPLNDSTLIASSNNGLTILNIINGNVKSYFAYDGLHSNSYEEASGDRKGNYIFLGGPNGITRVDISKIKSDKVVPSLSFSTITSISQDRITDTLNIAIEKISIPSYITQVVINYSAINYSAPEKLKYAYRIIGENENWTFTNQNFVQSFRLSPGTYHLQVQAFNEDGIPSEIKELTLIFEPKWYQTWWFRSLLALIVIGIGYTIYRVRIAQLKKEDKIRSRLASDLHDDLGSTLNSIKVYSNLALMQRDNPDHLVKIKQSTQDAISGIRDIIWVLDDKKDTVEDLLNRVKQFAAPLCDANQVKFITEADSAFHHHKLGKEEKRNLYMILKESINNSIKYAECATIRLQLTAEARKLKIVITDDGKGFNNTKASEGNGLKNISTRAKEIGYTSRIISSAGQGTRIILTKN
jgi:ligand-binding sensor domain-containing protein/two-component sensor histidine kinase